MKKRNLIFKISILGMLAFIILPIIVELLLIIPSTKPLAVGSKDGWLSFFGSYMGGIIGGTVGGIATIFGIKMTLDYSKEKDNDEKRRSILPYIHVEEKKIIKDEITKYIIKDSSPSDIKYINVELRNIGLGSAVAIKFEFNILPRMIIENIKEISSLTLNETRSLYIQVPVSIINNNTYLITIIFKDLLGNIYQQDMIFLVQKDAFTISRVTEPLLSSI